MKCTILLSFCLLLSACSYKWGFRDRVVPGGYKQVAIPVFKNKSQSVGVETDFTNALIRRFERSQVAHVTSKDIAPVRIDGIIEKVDLVPGSSGVVGAAGATNPLPGDAVLTTDYVVRVRLKIQVRRQSDEKVIWEGIFEDTTDFQASRIGEPVVNSANALYDDSARKYATGQLAENMMSEAHDRITENF
jgi:hypothetical protein